MTDNKHRVSIKFWNDPENPSEPDLGTISADFITEALADDLVLLLQRHGADLPKDQVDEAEDRQKARYAAQDAEAIREEDEERSAFIADVTANAKIVAPGPDGGRVEIESGRISYITKDYVEPEPKALLGLANTHDLIWELAARVNVARIVGETWPEYRTVDDPPLEAEREHDPEPEDDQSSCPCRSCRMYEAVNEASAVLKRHLPESTDEEVRYSAETMARHVCSERCVYETKDEHDVGSPVDADAVSRGVAAEGGETVHMVPPGDQGIMPCCGRTPFEARGDRMTADRDLVTCGGSDGPHLHFEPGFPVEEGGDAPDFSLYDEMAVSQALLDLGARQADTRHAARTVLQTILDRGYRQVADIADADERTGGEQYDGKDSDEGFDVVEHRPIVAVEVDGFRIPADRIKSPVDFAFWMHEGQIDLTFPIRETFVVEYEHAEEPF